MLKIIDGDLLEAKEKYIVHQTNCVSSIASGLAYHLFKKYPYADVYSERLNSNYYSYGSDIVTKKDIPGTILIRGNGKDKRYVINLMGQYYPGLPNMSKDHMDNEDHRRQYFYQCLVKISQIPELESIAFPYKIGCGLAGGDFKVYFNILKNFSNYVSLREHNKANVTIYKLTNI